MSTEILYLETSFDNVPKLLRLIVAWVRDLEVTTLCDNFLSSKCPPSESPSRVGPPLLDLRDLLLVLRVFGVYVRHYVVGSECRNTMYVCL
jgi:hypothetical protein